MISKMALRSRCHLAAVAWQKTESSKLTFCGSMTVDVGPVRSLYENDSKGKLDAAGRPPCILTWMLLVSLK